MVHQIDHIIVNKLAGNKLSDQESKKLESWLLLDDNATVFTDLSKLWNVSEAINYKAQVDVDQEWQNFIKNTQIKKSKIRRIYSTVASVAASVIIVLGIYFTLGNQAVTYQYSQNENHFTLPDSSEVWLNKNSTLTVSRKYDKKDRIVKLNGEAFFVVEKSENPFVVKMKNGISAKVLGTSFNLNSYALSKVQLQVVTGAVEFGSKRHSKLAIVEKDNEAVYFNKSRKLIKYKSKNKNKLSWRTGEFNFNNDPVIEVANLLEKYLSLEIEMPVSARELHFSGKFNSPSAYDVAVVLSKALGYDYVLTSDKLVFQPKQ